MPGEVIAHLDEAIEDLVNATHLKRAALAFNGWGQYATKLLRSDAKITALNA